VRTLFALGAQPLDSEGSWTEWNGAVVARLSVTGGPGYRVFAPTEQREQLLSLLEARGVVTADDEAVRTVRLERGRPRYGEDITESHIAQETDQSRALHFNKGCYVGQEIVERVRSRGHLNRILTPLRINAAVPPAHGARITAGEKDAGEITSAAFSPGLGCVVALGYVRTEHLGQGTQLNAGGAAAMVIASEALTK
jgi:aminomethyltransferase